MTKKTHEEMRTAMEDHARRSLAAMRQEAESGYPDAKRYLAQVQPTYIEAWPRGLCSLSIAQADVTLTLAEAATIGRHMAEFGEAFTSDEPLLPIEIRVNDAVSRFPRGAFIRLGSRSPKDSFLAHRAGSMRVLSATTEIIRENSPLRFILDASERMYDDLTLALHACYEPHIFVRQWVTLDKWQEFRCFMRKRQLVGISQYYYMDGALPDIIQNADVIKWAIERFFGQFRQESHLEDVVFDVYVARTQRGNESAWEVRLLEINPFFEMTDPCLFDWRDGGDFASGAFRFVE